MKKIVYFNEYNIPMNKCVYLPYVSGLLQAYCQKFDCINNEYEFAPFIFMRDTPQEILKKYINPSIAAFSVSIWNYRLSLEVAKRVKQKFPSCIIIFGGCNVYEEYPFIDFVIKHQGEKKFAILLAELINKKIDTDSKHLDDFTSPYSSGLYNYLFKEYPEYNFQVIVETNRGCPFTCTFCYWGQNLDEKKVQFHSLEYIREEAEWFGKNKIQYIFLADANFGMYKQDLDIAKIYVEIKNKYSYPDKIRACYGKNKEQMVFDTANLLSKNNLNKAITLAIQSNNLTVLENIKRKNIKLDVYHNLQKKYADENISTYTEIILGLPGETTKSFKSSIEEIIKGETSLFIYHCSVLPNTEMAHPDYLKKFGIETVRVPLSETHCEIRRKEHVIEYEEIIIKTNTMSKSEWIDMAVYSWKIQLQYVFGINLIPEKEIKIFYDIAEGITKGESRCQIDKRFGEIYWEPEELAYLRICFDKGIINEDLKTFAKKNVIWGRKGKKLIKG